MSKIAIYGGSFNPIHSGHLIVAEEVRQLFCLDKVVFVPAAQPPHKSSKLVIDSSHRLAMARLAIENNPCFDVSDIEIKRGGTSYTVNTLKYLRQKHGDASQLYFIIGSDAFIELDTWRQARDLLKLAYFIVIERPGASLDKTVKFLQRFDPQPCQILSATLLLNKTSPLVGENKVFFVQATLANISSSNIRALIQNGKSVRYIVPDIVRDYIAKHKLYK